MRWNIGRAGIAVVCLCAAVPALAETKFRIRKTRDDAPAGKGQCEIRLQVDNEVEVAVRRDVVRIRTLAGQGARDNGSECNMPLPDRAIEGFNFQVVESRNEIRLVSGPSLRTDWTAVVHIRDTSGGFGRYHFRLSWAVGGGLPRETPRDSGYRPEKGGDSSMAWNNTLHFSGSGRGQSRADGSGEQNLGSVAVDIDRGGRIQVSFRGEGGRALTFNGTLMGQEGDSIKADVMTENRRLRGPMYLSLDNRRNISRIALEATDGRDRLQLNWERR